MQQKKNIKIWTATPDSQAGVMVTENKAFLIADRNNYVVATPNGTIISGKSVVLNTTSENIRGGGIFVKMNDFVQMIPQTLVTPMPNQIPFPPLGFAMGIVDDLAFFMAMVGGG